MSFVVFSVLASVGLHRRNATQWRVVNPPIRGEIHGLPRSSGRLIATDGLLCVIDRYNQTPFLGHLATFVKDPKDPGQVPPLRETDKEPKADRVANELLNLI